ncbi:SCO family protein [Aliiroseovarius sp. PTFE2010]|uniref:SCO family protein n=1 Tax=Aliiroseovarius sp. PTFE2010 TaxID=3417190 RepID=UPI003CF8B4B6
MNKIAMRKFRILIWGAVLVTGIWASWFFLIGPGAGPGQPPETGLNLGRGDYRLVTTSGGDFTQDSLVGQPSLVFFGFTHCPDVCPTTLGDIAGWKDELGLDEETLPVYFVTVDPARDTIDVLREYVGWLPGAIGVTGAPEEMARALEAFRIYAKKIPLQGGDYSMDHSAYVMLFDQTGAFDQIFSYQADPERVVAILRRVLREGS